MDPKDQNTMGAGSLDYSRQTQAFIAPPLAAHVDPPEPVPELAKVAPEPSKEERASTLVAEYERAMDHNAPRTSVELNELRDLLGVK